MKCSLCQADVVRGRLKGPGTPRLVTLDAAPTRAGRHTYTAPAGHDRVLVRRLGGDTLRATRAVTDQLYTDHASTCPHGAIPAEATA